MFLTCSNFYQTQMCTTLQLTTQFRPCTISAHAQSPPIRNLHSFKLDAFPFKCSRKRVFFFFFFGEIVIYHIYFPLCMYFTLTVNKEGKKDHVVCSFAWKRFQVFFFHIRFFSKEILVIRVAQNIYWSLIFTERRTLSV